jgi:hypothetical protein
MSQARSQDLFQRGVFWSIERAANLQSLRNEEEQDEGEEEEEKNKEGFESLEVGIGGQEPPEEKESNLTKRFAILITIVLNLIYPCCL